MKKFIRITYDNQILEIEDRSSSYPSDWIIITIRDFSYSYYDYVCDLFEIVAKSCELSYSYFNNTTDTVYEIKVKSWKDIPENYINFIKDDLIYFKDFTRDDRNRGSYEYYKI